jgi:hypothetical protein
MMLVMTTTTLKVAATIVALAHVAMAQAESPGVFEVASVKPAGPVPAGGGNQRRGWHGAGLRWEVPRLDNSRFSVTTTPYALITWDMDTTKLGAALMSATATW